MEISRIGRYDFSESVSLSCVRPDEVISRVKVGDLRPHGKAAHFRIFRDQLIQPGADFCRGLLGIRVLAVGETQFHNEDGFVFRSFHR